MTSPNVEKFPDAWCGKPKDASTRRIFYRALFRLAALSAIFLLIQKAHSEPRHGIAMHGEPAYAPGFEHLNYVYPGAPKGGALRRGVLGSFDSLNPYIISGQPAPGVKEYVHESLLGRVYDEPFSLYGLLAESIDTPADRSWAAFRIRPEARFSDGAPVTPDDVLFSYRVLKAKGRPFHRTYYAKVLTAEKTGERDVTFTFQSGDREMPLIMGLMPVFEAQSVSAENFDQSSLAPMRGSGPYVVDNVVQGSMIRYRRNPEYWGRDLPFNRGQHNFDKVEFEFYRDSTALNDAFRKGLIDVVGDEAPIDANTWAEGFDFPAARDGRVKKVEFHVGVPAGMTGFVFNTRRAPFSDRRVRQALTYALNLDWVNKTLFHDLYVQTQSFFDRSDLASTAKPSSDGERALLGPYLKQADPAVLEGAFKHPPGDPKGINRDGRKHAIALLSEAGYEVRDGAMVEAANGKPLTFEMLCLNRDQERLMLTFAHFLSQIGIEARVRLVDSAQYQRRLTSFDFDVIQTTWSASLSPGNEQTFRWSSQAAREEGSFNYAGVASDGVDAMIEAMLSAKTRPAFVDAVRALDRLLISGHYVAPLFYPRTQWVALWSRLRFPETSNLYGARVETWWSDPTQTAALQ